MPSIPATIARLKRLQVGSLRPGGTVAPGRLVPFEDFGGNPGMLKAWAYVPADLQAGAPLVTVLHGCTQTAAGYDRGAGWSTLADRFGFALLYPEQQRANNPNLCFNWFAPGDARRGSGEAESIRAMVSGMLARHALDPSRVFVTGLSAGGAMTSVMLATYPELFAGGAVIAGLPYGTAVGVPEALERMRGHGHDRATLSDRVRSASSHRGPWPSVAVWHGTADATVDAVNAAMIVDQWRGVHGVGVPTSTERRGGHLHRVWRDPVGRVVVEDHAIAGLGHGTPLAAAGDEGCGVVGPYMLEAGVSSTYRIAASWGIVPAAAQPSEGRPVLIQGADRAGETRLSPAAFDPGQVINNALRAAGLMKC